MLRKSFQVVRSNIFHTNLQFFQKFAFSSTQYKHYHDGNRESYLRDYLKVNEAIIEMLEKLSENPNPESDMLLSEKKRSKSKGGKQRTVIGKQYKSIMRNFLRKYEEVSPRPQELANLISLITKDDLIVYQRKELRTIVSFLNTDTINLLTNNQLEILFEKVLRQEKKFEHVRSAPGSVTAKKPDPKYTSPEAKFETNDLKTFVKLVVKLLPESTVMPIKIVKEYFESTISNDKLESINNHDYKSLIDYLAVCINFHKENYMFKEDDKDMLWKNYKYTLRNLVKKHFIQKCFSLTNSLKLLEIGL